MKQTKREALQKCDEVVRGECKPVETEIIGKANRLTSFNARNVWDGDRVCSLLFRQNSQRRLGVPITVQECAGLHEAVYFRRSNVR